MQRTNIILLFGGESSEHAVSINSARNVFAALDDTKYDVILVYIDISGRWWLVENISENIDTSTLPQVLPLLGSGSFIAQPITETIVPDVILPILHGENGEDGTVQALAELVHVPIVGAKTEASAIAMDKITTKMILSGEGILVTPYKTHIRGEPYQSFHQLAAELGSPLFVKPSNGGSSVGASKVENDDQLSAALIKAHEYDDRILIEKSVSARELEVAVLGSGNKIRVSGVGEIKPNDEFYTYQSKYDPTSRSEVIVPAEISDELREQIKQTALKAYHLLDCKGMARVDFFLSDDSSLYLNEIQTLPGFTSISMYPKLWRNEGVTYSGLIDVLINDALEK
jgi:D-alanine-D-alanine ligase